MITEYKTKKEVLIDTITGRQAIVFISIDNILFEGTMFVANVLYKTKETETDEWGQIFHQSPTSFTNDEVKGLEQMLGVTGDTIAEKLIDLAMKTLPVQIEKLGILGLKASDLELVIQEVTEENND